MRIMTRHSSDPPHRLIPRLTSQSPARLSAIMSLDAVDTLTLLTSHQEQDPQQSDDRPHSDQHPEHPLQLLPEADVWRPAVPHMLAELDEHVIASPFLRLLPGRYVHRAAQPLECARMAGRRWQKQVLAARRRGNNDAQAQWSTAPLRALAHRAPVLIGSRRSARWQQLRSGRG